MTLTLSFLPQTSFSATVPLSVKSPGGPEWVRQEKIRLGWSPSHFEQYPLMRAAGMNSVMPRIELVASANYKPEEYECALNGEDEAALEKLRQSSSLAKKTGLRYFHCLGIACVRSTVNAGFQDNVARFNDDKLPSPIDPVYWQRTILDRVDRTLRLLKDEEKYALDAIIVDPEMYALGDGIPGEADYGTYAFERFLAEHPDTPKAEEASTPKARKEWLAAQGLTNRYLDWQRDEIVGLGRKLRNLVDSYRPGVIIGFIIYENRLWFNAMAAGMSHTGMPVFVGPESTYSGVMDDGMSELFAGMRRNLNVPCLLVPGVSVGRIKNSVPHARLAVLPGNIYQRCQRTDGYWVYAIYSFGQTEEEQRPYFDMLKRVNDALDEQAETGISSSDFVAAPFPAEVPPDFDEVLKLGQSLKPLDKAIQAASLSYVEPKLRGSYTLLQWPSSEMRNSITVRSVQLNKNYLDPVSTTIFGKDGQELYVAPTALEQTRIVWLPDLANGFCAQVTDAGQNSFGIAEATAPLMIHAPDGITTNSQGGEAGTFYFYVPKEKENFKVEMSGWQGETVEYLIHDPTGRTYRHWKGVQKPLTETIPTGGMEGVWAISMKNARNNASFKLLTLPNLFALKPEDVRN